MSEARKGPSKGFLIAVIVAPIVFILLIIGIISCSNSSSDTSSAMSIGSEHKITNSSGGTIYIATNRDSWNQLSKAVMAGDDTGVNNLLVSGRIFPVNVGSKVKIIDQDWTVLQVRVQNGTNSGRSGWVGSEFLK
ncbi:hypothetical protein A2V71_03015 [Candidatus Berkelbacteria bacterium RBG_13_40_8]|uniref:Uncharacterized protein n=1 Tax=Candidatus Berkelbacteria bacterium RBG_13_40_8 TaxID=1797467 RepID=A0A1F5DP76_9BACT|nr:MAG: hypothetical protein A2V71_03015 [Candidatus Berkelbacteria bacterium RBG_13_40_8]